MELGEEGKPTIAKVQSQRIDSGFGGEGFLDMIGFLGEVDGLRGVLLLLKLIFSQVIMF
jgi:hypothetical protein